MSIETGSLIQLHTHENKPVLDELSESQQQELLYRGIPLQTQISISQIANNILTMESDGLYVGLSSVHSHSNLSILDKFSEDENGKPLYDGHSIKSDISTQTGNIIEEKSDGLYATVTLATVQDINDLIDYLWNGSNFISSDLKSIQGIDGLVFKARE